MAFLLFFYNVVEKATFLLSTNKVMQEALNKYNSSVKKT